MVPTHHQAGHRSQELLRPAWHSLSEDEKTVYARQMEVYATLGRAPITRSVGWSTRSRILASWTIAVLLHSGDNGGS